jgi:hypothetical protein
MIKISKSLIFCQQKTEKLDQDFGEVYVLLSSFVGE